MNRPEKGATSVILIMLVIVPQHKKLPRYEIFQKKINALVVASKETGLEVNAEKMKYVIVSRDQNAGQISNIKMGSKSF